MEKLRFKYNLLSCFYIKFKYFNKSMIMSLLSFFYRAITPQAPALVRVTARRGPSTLPMGTTSTANLRSLRADPGPQAPTSMRTSFLPPSPPSIRACITPPGERMKMSGQGRGLGTLKRG